MGIAGKVALVAGGGKGIGSPTEPLSADLSHDGNHEVAQ